MADIFNMLDTWNAPGTVFTGIKLNVTDTASAAGSLLMDLQVGGVSKFKVDNAGSVYPAAGSYAGGGVRFPTANVFITEFSSGLWMRAGTPTGYSDGVQVFIKDDAFSFSGPVRLGWANSGYPNAAVDLAILRDAANTLGQRNGVNAQAHRIYGTYTDASNYRRLTKTMSTGGVAEIKPEGLGTGVSGNVLHISGLPTSNPGPGILWNNAGTPAIGT